MKYLLIIRIGLGMGVCIGAAARRRRAVSRRPLDEVYGRHLREIVQALRLRPGKGRGTLGDDPGELRAPAFLAFPAVKPGMFLVDPLYEGTNFPAFFTFEFVYRHNAVCSQPK